MGLCAKMFNSLLEIFSTAKLATEAPSYMFVMIGFYSKRDSESCYIRHYEDTSYSQRPEAATRGGALSL